MNRNFSSLQGCKVSLHHFNLHKCMASTNRKVPRFFRVFFKYQVFLLNLFPPDFLGILLWYFFVPRFVCFSFLLLVFLYRSIFLGFVFVAYFCFLSCRIAFGCFLDAFCLAFVLYFFGHFILMFFLCQICR